MKKFLIAGIAAAAFCGAPALAADMPTKAPIYKAVNPVFNWSGCYLGADIGYARQRDKDDAFLASTGEPLGFFASTDPRGIKGGGYLGCNWQSASNWIIGLEGDAEAANIKHSFEVFKGVAPVTFYEPHTRFQGSVRGRIGYAVDHSLLYVTGGVAFADFINRYINTSVISSQDASSTRAGWTLGAGLDYAITNNLIGRIEYRYSDFGKHTDNGISFGGSLVNERHYTKEDAIRVGIAYKFGSQ
jgi:outer membrane immunogenic protein